MTSAGFDVSAALEAEAFYFKLSDTSTHSSPSVFCHAENTEHRENAQRIGGAAMLMLALLQPATTRENS
jgi:hypothetical protein